MALGFLDTGKGISCQKEEHLSSCLGWGGVPPKRKATLSMAALRGEAINECWISSNSSTLLASRWPNTLASTLQRWGGAGWVEGQ